MNEETVEPAHQLRVWYVFKVLVCMGGIAGGVWVLANLKSTTNPADFYPMAVGVPLVQVLLLLAICRNLIVLRRLPFIRLTPAGIQLRYWKGNCSGLLLPWPKLVVVGIPWAEYAGCHTCTSEGLFMWENYLIIKQTGVEDEASSHRVQCWAYGVHPDRLMTAVLNYVADREHAALESAGINKEVTQDRRRRFQEPVLLQDRLSRACLPGFLLGIPLCALGIYIGLFIEGGSPVMAWAMGIVGYVIAMAGVIAMGGYIKNYRCRIVQLRSEGLLVGRRVESAQMHSWDDVVTIRLILAREAYTSKEATVNRLEILLKDGNVISLPNRYECSLKELQEMMS